MSFGMIQYKSPFRSVPRNPDHVCGFCGTHVDVKYAYDVDSSDKYPEASRVDEKSVYSCSSCTLKKMFTVSNHQLEYDFDLNDPHKYMATLQRMYKDLETVRAQFQENWTYCCGCKTYIRTENQVTGITDNNRSVLRCSICGNINRFLD